MADQAGVPRIVLVHFRAELQQRIDEACATRPGAMAGRPGLQVEVEPAADGRVVPAASVAPAPHDVAPDGSVHGLVGAPADPIARATTN